jgi:predicted nucleic acid-binding protein
MFCSRRGSSVGCGAWDSRCNRHEHFDQPDLYWPYGVAWPPPGLRFVIPDEVIAEILHPDQQQVVDEAIAAGHVQRESISGTEELALFAELRQVLGAGESSCLALAEKRCWIVACDEKRVFLREARRRLGDGRMLNTPGIYVLSIRAGLITVAAADEAKATLEKHRFQMAFRSFSELLDR